METNEIPFERKIYESSEPVPDSYIRNVKESGIRPESSPLE